MKIGYVGDSTLNDFKSARTFRLASYTPEIFLEKARLNLQGVKENIEYAHSKGILLYRLRSEIIPFASHAVCKEDWKNTLAKECKEIAVLIKNYQMRIGTHPDQFVVINSPNENVVANSIKELDYQAELLDAIELGQNHKMQIHGGGVYGDKGESMKRFAKVYKTLSDTIRKHLVIENDDKLYTVNDCYSIYEETGIPILFDNFHFSLNNDNEDMLAAMEKAFSTWKKEDGIPMVDYSSQQEGFRAGKHAATIDEVLFSEFISQTKHWDFDIMLEIKDKDQSAIKALSLIK